MPSAGCSSSSSVDPTIDLLKSLPSRDKNSCAVRAVVLFAYWVMAGWLIVAAVIRVGLLVHAGLPLDVLPLVSGALGLLAIVGRLTHQWSEGRRASRSVGS